MHIYRGFISDSERWHRFKFRDDDVVITTPSKCGTTWMQSIVGTLILGSPDLPPVIWFDCLLRSEAETTAIVEAQTHRRFLKTHTPYDGLPKNKSVTFITIARHPLDVALSNYDHALNQRRDRTIELRHVASGIPETRTNNDNDENPPTDRGDYLRWWIDNNIQPDGAGPYGLADFCQQVQTYWDARKDPNLHLFHYSDLWNDLDGEMRRVADILNIDVTCDELFSLWVDAMTLDSMKSRSDQTVPEAHLGLWKSTEQFFAKGGTRDWRSLLTDQEIAHFEARLETLVGADAARWIKNGGPVPI